MDRKALLVLATLLTVALAAIAAAPATQPGPVVGTSFELKDVDGKACRPLGAARARGARGVVFLFVAIDCPISNGYSPEIERICDAYGKSDKRDGAFDFYFVHADPDLSVADARKHASDYGYACPVLMDPKKELAGKLGAVVTPEVFVVSTAGSLLYQGRIDDRYVGYGKLRAEPTKWDLRDALDAIAAGKPVATPVTKAIGCPI